MGTCTRIDMTVDITDQGYYYWLVCMCKRKIFNKFFSKPFERKRGAGGVARGEVGQFRVYPTSGLVPVLYTWCAVRYSSRACRMMALLLQ